MGAEVTGAEVTGAKVTGAEVTGAPLSSLVGMAVGSEVAFTVGSAVVVVPIGADVTGAEVTGAEVTGIADGTAVGLDEVGVADGSDDVGIVDGAAVGTDEVGIADGSDEVGSDVVGVGVGLRLGIVVAGLPVGFAVGRTSLPPPQPQHMTCDVKDTESKDLQSPGVSV